jgi:hypothetical protein
VAAPEVPYTAPCIRTAAARAGSWAVAGSSTKTPEELRLFRNAAAVAAAGTGTHLDAAEVAAVVARTSQRKQEPAAAAAAAAAAADVVVVVVVVAVVVVPAPARRQPRAYPPPSRSCALFT